MKKSTQSKSMDRERRRELSSLRRERKTAIAQSTRELTALHKKAEKIVAVRLESDAKLARRIAILETRLG